MYATEINVHFNFSRKCILISFPMTEMFSFFFSVGDTCSLDDDLCTAYCSVANVRIK